MSLVCFESRWILGLTIGETRSQWMFAALSGSVLAMTLMLLTEENEMFIKHQYSGVCLSSDFTMTYYGCTPDYCCIFTYMNL